MAWELTNGAIPPGLHVLHSCDNPACCNPAHLSLGTDSDNAADKQRKGRQARGEAHGSAKLTAEDVRWLRWARAYSGASYATLASAFGVSKQTAVMAAKGTTWR